MDQVSAIAYVQNDFFAYHELKIVHNCLYMVVTLTIGASSLEKGVCCGRAALDITFQQSYTFS